MQEFRPAKKQVEVSALARSKAALSGDFAVNIAEVATPQPLTGYLAAMKLADAEATARLGSHMLLSWYDRDRNFESPQHASECSAPGAMPGYAVYGLHHGATLMVDIEQGRFVFFYFPLE